jgi:hypothetical protein
MGGGPGTVRFSLTAYIPFGKVTNSLTKDVFKGDGRSASWYSNHFRTQVNFSLDRSSQKVTFGKGVCGTTYGLGGNAKGYVGQAQYFERHMAISVNRP